MAEVSVFNRSLSSFSLPLNCISLEFILFFISYAMTGKLGGHAGPVMTVLLKETNKESLVFTGSRDHYVKVREFMDPPFRRDRTIMDRRKCVILSLFSSHLATVVVQWREFKCPNKDFQFFSAFCAFLVGGIL